MSSKTNLPLFRKRQEKIFSYLQSRGCDAAVLADFEGLRNRSLRYLCGHPQDALLFLFAKGKSVLVPWDIHLAETWAHVDTFLPYTEYKRSLAQAVESIILQQGGIRTVELSGKFFYPEVNLIASSLGGIELVCEEQGLDQTLLSLRSIKDPVEMEQLKRAFRITDQIIADVTHWVQEKTTTEQELALYIEARAREMGADGLGFETVVAGPKRSFNIHAFPSYTASDLTGEGFSIVDFGVCVAGYTSDVTLTVLGRDLSRRQSAMSETVQEVYALAQSLLEPGAGLVDVARRVDEAIKERGFDMPHSLGHGIGLDAHEAPLLRARAAAEEAAGAEVDAAGDAAKQGLRLEPGMVFTIEPGLYDADAGGIRLENDFLCTTEGIEVLTHSRLIHRSG